MAESLECFEKVRPYHHSFGRVDKKKKIGVVRTDNHGLIYAYCLGKADRYEFLQASGQLYILEDKWDPVIPIRSTEVKGCYGKLLIPNDKWTKEELEGAQRGVDTLAWQPQAFAKAFDCPIYDTLEEMADPELFDGILVGNCSWYAQDHVELCMPFIKKGIPIFIDKPFARSAQDAALLLKAAREYNCPIFSTSILYYDDMQHNLEEKKLGRTSMVVSTFKCKIEQRNASVHALSALLGAVRFSNGNDYKVENITYMGTGDAENRNEVYRLEFADGTIGIMNLKDFGHYAFHVQAYCEKGISSEYCVERSLRGGIIEIANEFAKMIDTRIPPVEYDRIFEFVAILDAGARSKTEGGRTVPIDEIAQEAGWTFGTSDREKE